MPDVRVGVPDRPRNRGRGRAATVPRGRRRAAYNTRSRHLLLLLLSVICPHARPGHQTKVLSPHVNVVVASLVTLV